MLLPLTVSCLSKIQIGSPVKRMYVCMCVIQEIGREERLRNDLFCVGLNVKPLLTQLTELPPWEKRRLTKYYFFFKFTRWRHCAMVSQDVAVWLTEMLAVPICCCTEVRVNS